ASYRSCLPHPAPTHTYTLSLHDALPICPACLSEPCHRSSRGAAPLDSQGPPDPCHRSSRGAAPLDSQGHARASRHRERAAQDRRSEEHTSELQSLAYLVCRLLLETKKYIMAVFSTPMPMSLGSNDSWVAQLMVMKLRVS